jgi:catechol 2,3-dioxygenase-like lactoylglutathione lyase family enzyme
MAIERMDHVGVVVDDLEAAIAFFGELGLELDGQTTVEGRWVDRVARLDDVRADIAMMRTPDGHGGLELTRYHRPAAIGAELVGEVTRYENSYLLCYVRGPAGIIVALAEELG